MRLITPLDFLFLALQSMGVFYAFDGMIHNPQIWAGGLTLLSTLITVGFNIYKLYRDNKNSETPRSFKLRGRRGKKHEK